MPPSAVQRPVRIGGASGGFSDRVHAITQLAKDPNVDVIVGDWLSEMTMTIHGAGKIENSKKITKESQSFEEEVKGAMFAENFIDCFEPAIPYLAKNGAKLAVNAGASDTEILAKLVLKMCEDAGHPMKVAWIEGDDVTDAVAKLTAQGEKFESLMHGKALEDWGFDPICAQAYLGGLGIAEAFRQGADIVICGRVADAAPTIGAAAYVLYHLFETCERLIHIC
jgi:Acyclic terpene utilisation family protein AtuA